MSGPSAAPTPRIGARVLLLDPDDRVLLIHERWFENDVPHQHWITPGGGIEPGETFRQAAAREAWEELGVRITLPADSAEVFTEQRAWGWQGQRYLQTDHYYVARIPADTPISHPALTEMEQQTVLGQRWWSLAELASSSEDFVPASIVEVLRRMLPGVCSGPGPGTASGQGDRAPS